MFNNNSKLDLNTPYRQSQALNLYRLVDTNIVNIIIKKLIVFILKQISVQFLLLMLTLFSNVLTLNFFNLKKVKVNFLFFFYTFIKIDNDVLFFHFKTHDCIYTI